MAYATQGDLEARFGTAEVLQLSDRNNDGSPDIGVLDAALNDASQEIDGYLARQYTLPLASVPALVVRLACDIARYLLWSSDPTERVRHGYEDAIATLRGISSGAIRLNIATPADAVSCKASPIVVLSGDPVFTDELLSRMP